MIDNKTIRKVIMLNKMLPSGSPTYENREAEGAVANFTTNVAMPFVSLDCEILPIQSGTGTPSPSNPRPISGTSVLNVEQRGKNLLDYSSTITKEANTVTSTFIADLNFKAGLTYTISATQTPTAGSQTRNTFYLVTPSGTTVYGISDLSIRPMTYTATESGTFKLYLWNHTLDVDVTYSDFQVEIGTTPSAYEPYTGSTYTVNLGRTIYGGSADVVGGTGEETHGIVDLGDLTWTYKTDVLSVPCFLSSDISDIKNGTLPLACSCFKIMSPNRTAIDGNYQASIGNNTNAKYLVIRYDEYTDGATVKTALTGQKLVYELATPTDFTFTGQPINSLLGVNNVWTDSGDTKVTYKYKTGEGGSSKKKYLPIFYDLYGKGCRHL